MINGPEYSWSTYLWVLWLSWWGASAAYLQRIKNKGPSAFSWWSFFIECFVAGFSGLLTFYMADYHGLDERLVAVGVALSGHFSTRAIFLLRESVLSRVRANGDA